MTAGTAEGPGRSRWDLLLVVVAVGLDLALFTRLSDGTGELGWAGDAAPAWAVLTLGALAVPLLVLRRRAPVGCCLGLAAHAAVVTVLLGSRPLVGLLVGLYTAAVAASRAKAWIPLAAVLFAHGIAVAYETSFAGSTVATVTAVGVVYLVLDCATWAAGRWGAGAAARAREARLEAAQAELAELAVAEERRRIARELHDIVAHAITVMVLQASGAHRLAVTDPDRASAAMRSVEEVGQQAVVELRRLLGVLSPQPHRREADSEPWQGEQLATRVEELCDRLVASGLRVRLVVLGTTVRLEPSVELAAFRVAQEGLTNSAKHAGPGVETTVRLEWEATRLVVRVTNGPVPGRVQRPVTGVGGFGLAGLTERVRLVGGEVEFGRLQDGGFELSAALPAGGHPMIPTRRLEMTPEAPGARTSRGPRS